MIMNATSQIKMVVAVEDGGNIEKGRWRASWARVRVNPPAVQPICIGRGGEFLTNPDLGNPRLREVFDISTQERRARRRDTTLSIGGSELQAGFTTGSSRVFAQ